MKLQLAIVGLALVIASPVFAGTRFVLSNAGLNRVSFESEAPFETITGVSTATEGAFDVDLKDPNRTTGRVKIPVNTIKTGNDMRDGHLTQEMWLNAERYPELTFEIKSVALESPRPLQDGVKLRGKATGNLTIKGVTKVVVANIVVSYHNKVEKLASFGLNDDIIRIKALFKVNIRDFNINPPEHIANLKVADEVTIKADLTALKTQ